MPRAWNSKVYQQNVCNMAVHFESCKHGHLFQRSTPTVDGKLHWNTLLTRNIGSGARSFFSATVNLIRIRVNNIFVYPLYSWTRFTQALLSFSDLDMNNHGTSATIEVLRFLALLAFDRGEKHLECHLPWRIAHLKSYCLHHPRRTP